MINQQQGAYGLLAKDRINKLDGRQAHHGCLEIEHYAVLESNEKVG